MTEGVSVLIGSLKSSAPNWEQTTAAKISRELYPSQSVAHQL